MERKEYKRYSREFKLETFTLTLMAETKDFKSRLVIGRYAAAMPEQVSAKF